MNQRDAEQACTLLAEVLTHADAYAAALRSIDPFRPEPALHALSALKKSHARWVSLAGEDYPDAFAPDELEGHLADFREAMKGYAKALRKMHASAEKLARLLSDAVAALESGSRKEVLSAAAAAEKLTAEWARDATPVDDNEREIFEEIFTSFAEGVEAVLADLETEITDWEELEIEYDEEPGAGMTENRPRRSAKRSR